MQNSFRPHIVPVYPPNNFKIFEEWFGENYNGCNTDRELIPAYFTSYWVNNDYGNNGRAKQEMQEYIDGLDRNKRWFTVVQYDDSVLIDFKDLDVLRFEMSKNIGTPLPLLNMPHPYKFTSPKKYIANFVGGRTHPIRDELNQFKDKEGWYISFEQHDIERYCEIIYQSLFTLCPRGYGINSFRITEALQYGSIPVYISDDFINPFNNPFYEYGITLHSKHIKFLEDELERRNEKEIVAYQDKGKAAYGDMYTYDGCLKNIINELELEYNLRQQGRKIAETI